MKYIVECGGFVNTFNKKEDGFVERLRHRKITVYAKSKEEAIEKASDKFVAFCQAKAGNMYCDDVNIDSVTLIQNEKAKGYERGTNDE